MMFLMPTVPPPCLIHRDPPKAMSIFGEQQVDCGNGVIGGVVSTVNLTGHRSVGISVG